MQKVYGFDDEEVVTGDGAISVESEVDGVEKVRGSRSFVRDIRLTTPGYKASRPDYGHIHIPSVPRDKNGVLMRFCSGGHYAPRAMFGNRKRNFLHGLKDGLDDTCTDCRKLQRHQHNRSSSMPA